MYMRMLARFLLVVIAQARQRRQAALGVQAIRDVRTVQGVGTDLEGVDGLEKPSACHTMVDFDAAIACGF